MTKTVAGASRPAPGDLARDASARRPAPRRRLPLSDRDWIELEQAMADTVDPRDDPASPSFVRVLDDDDRRIDSHWDEEHEAREARR